MKSYLQYLANGEIRQVADAGTRSPVVSPVTQEIIGEVGFCSIRQLGDAVDGARRAQAAWADSSLDERRQALQRLRQAIEARSEAFAVALAEEIGCPMWLGRLMQVPMALRDLDHAVEGLGQIVWQEPVGNGLVERVPVGVIGAIAPWNFPLHQIVAKVAAAVAAGCAIVLKPSEVAPGVARLFIEAVQAAGLPPGLVNVLWGSSELGQALVDHPGVDQISFTGSTAVGRRIMAAAAARVARVTLELGGKSAAVLLDDADLDAALPMVLRAGIVNSGQACVSQSRLLVPRQRLAEVEQRLVELVKGWQCGNPMDEATRLGPVATEAQFERINRMINAALKSGARLLSGGPRRPAGVERGWFLAPTLLHVTDPLLPISCEEVFGPVIAVLGYDDEDEAANLANATPYGLSGAVWSADTQRAAAFGRRMRTGQVVINGAAQNLATPFGGWGQSGFGRENGRFGIEECLQYRALHGAVPS